MTFGPRQGPYRTQPGTLPYRVEQYLIDQQAIHGTELYRCTLATIIEALNLAPMVPNNLRSCLQLPRKRGVFKAWAQPNTREKLYSLHDGTPEEPDSEVRAWDAHVDGQIDKANTKSAADFPLPMQPSSPFTMRFAARREDDGSLTVQDGLKKTHYTADEARVIFEALAKEDATA